MMHYALKTELVKFPAAGLQRTYYDCCLAPTPGELIAGTSVGEIMVFNTDNLLYRASLPMGTNGIVSICTCGNFVYVGSGDGKVKKVQGNDQYWSIVSEAQLSGRVTSLCTRADGEELLAGTDTATMYSVRCDTLAAKLLQESSVAALRAVAFGTRSDLFATVAGDGTVRIVDLSDYSVVARARGPCGASAVAFAGDERLVTGWEDGAVRIYSALSGDLVSQIAKCHRGRVTCIAVSSELIFTGGEDGQLRVWSRRTLEFVAQYSEHNKPITGLLVSILHCPPLSHSVQQLQCAHSGLIAL